MLVMADHSVVASRCPYCGHKFDRAANFVDDHNQVPTTGDITLCISCAAILEFDSGGVPVGLTPEREKEAAANPKVQRLRDAILALDRRKMRND